MSVTKPPEPRVIEEHRGYEYHTLDLSPGGIETMSELLGIVFPRATHLTPGYLDWLYNANPDGHAVGVNAYHDGRMVGHYATFPLRARVFGDVVRGAHSLNNGVHPDHRGKGLFPRLGILTHECNQEAGHEFVIGVPNANTTHVFASTFEFQLVGPLEARLGVGRISRAEGGGEVDYERVWDEPVVRWRLANPTARYTVSRRGPHCEVRAPAGQPGIRALLGWIDPAWAPSPVVASRPGFDLFIGADPALRWSRSAFVPIPMRLRPAPLNFVFRDLTGQGRRIAPERLRYAALDFDPY